MMFKKIALVSLGFISMVVATAIACPASVVGDLSINHRWVRPSTGPNTAAYFTVTNKGKETDKLIKVECAHATAVELHNNVEENGVTKMIPVNFIEIHNQDPVKMQPGGHHVMLMGLKDSFKGMEAIPLTLHFEKAGKVDINFPVTVKETSAPAA